MARAQATATSLDALCAQELLVATFRPGQSPAGHHWTVQDASGTVLARTKRVHSGGRLARTAWKAVTLTGLDAGNDIFVELLGAGDVKLARLESIAAQPAIVTATGESGAPVGRSVKDGATMRLDGGAVMEAEGDGPWAVTASGGAHLGELLAGEPGPSTSASWLDILVPVAPTNSGDFARTMHLGLRRVMRYAFKPEGRPTPELALLPLLAGLTY